MIDFKNSKSKTIDMVYRIVLLFSVVALILYLFPKEAKFQYEYSLNKPWSYSLLVAPYDFPIYKSEEELKIEQDSLLKTYSPYYMVDTSLVSVALAHFDSDYDRVFERLQLKNFKLQESAKKELKQEMSQVLVALLNEGVLSLSEKNQLEINGVKKINVIAGQFTRNVSLDNIHTSQLAYIKLLEDLRQMAINKKGIKDLSSFEHINLNNYIQPNLLYDQHTSENVKTELLNHVSVTSGMLLGGQRIIEKGQIIRPNVYQQLESYRMEHEKRMGSLEKTIYLLVGKGILISLLMMFFYLYLYFFRVDLFQNLKDLFFILLCMTAMVVVTAMARRIDLWSYYLVPYAILPIVLRTFFDSRTALFSHIVIILIISFMVPSGFQFIVLQIMAGMTVSFSLKNLDKRAQLVQTSFIVALTYSVGFTAIWLMTEGAITNISWYYFIYFLINALLLLLAYPLVYILEKTFKYLSDVTLMELGDTNHELLRRLSEEAPGTFQHSIQVSNLVHAAARRIGANALLARVGSLYHDIGKTVKSYYFTENQAKGISPHSVLSYEESARIVTGHVYEGVKLAHKHGLPKQIIDFITMHHGLGKAKYFYTMYKNEHPNEVVDESIFSYPGPNPLTKETAILMMADAVEATSRSLSEYTDEAISNMVNRIIDTQMAEGLFRLAPITFQDIELIKQSFIEKLGNVYHTRISYPSENKKSETEAKKAE